MSAQEKFNPYKDILMESNVRPAGFARRSWDVSIPSGVDFEKLFNFEYWKQCAEKFNLFDTLYIVSDDNLFYAELLVLQVSPKIGAKVEVKYFKDLETKLDALPSERDDYEIKWAGGAKFRIIRKKDNCIMETGIETKPEAEVVLTSILKATHA